MRAAGKVRRGFGPALLLGLVAGCAHGFGPLAAPAVPPAEAGGQVSPEGAAAGGPPASPDGAASPGQAGPPVPPEPEAPGASDPPACAGPDDRVVWGVVGLRGFPAGEHIASNGVEFKQLFALDLNFNIWLWRGGRLYLFSDSSFWGQKPAPGVTNPTQGSFDFSKREFDFSGGLAWNYAGPWEARLFAYSFNNLNRGTSSVSPSGFNDGVGLEDRYYLGPAYSALGTPAFDVARAGFVSLGYYPTKSMVDGNGKEFNPGPFARAYLTWAPWAEWLYLFGDAQLIGDRSFRPKLLDLDAGVAVRPCARLPRLEFRAGSQDSFDLQDSETEVSAYLSVRYVY
jgi:hypothetical protein